MPFIGDKKIYRAVMFVLNMIENGKDVNAAIKISSNYLGVSTGDISYYIRIAAAYEREAIRRWR